MKITIDIKRKFYDGKYFRDLSSDVYRCSGFGLQRVPRSDSPFQYHENSIYAIKYMFDAEAELRRCAGSQFDPKLVEVFLEVLKEEAS